MAQEIVLLIGEYGLLVVFLNVLVEQAGLPVPAVPTLVVAGALAANGQLPPAGVLAMALGGCLLADFAWYAAGRRFGHGVTRALCRISLSPDSCVRQSELRFQRWRGQVLLVAKFVPGLSTVAPPLVGAMGLGPGAFVLLDGAGSLLWAGLAVALGYAFSRQIDRVLDALESAGTLALGLLGALLAAYILLKWWQRWRLLRSLRMARISVEELGRALAAGEAPVVVDVRTAAARALDGRVIPGALLLDLDDLEPVLRAVPPERELVLYCNCPNEISAARVAQRLIEHGYRRVRPLLGGLDAWDAAGLALERVAAEEPAAGPAA
ncbi:DedA family protein/thiosulfate sulfurtransferase GlpE [Fulvimonas soli]|jgi:membrane protein DedA with SNARE-associated domain/rhodanese-related sulfurtransferase|uniref:Membrane protein DedA with SNARE-associated domain n=1 Tax=Fulvimonas soli TaxID=155197 RepID=A0A316I820_9GAMM|nr:DedA family protein/thiosulfate sulfurtransferase GlpE [Fulvimonas soli]PWK88589.1 membrane protein DedA with SNARE-associated domain [Fulvimonas soli]TNY27294.1 sulfurtransferase [Fulvimonas soli]